MTSKGAPEKCVSQQLSHRGRLEEAEEGEIVSRSELAHPSHSVQRGWEPGEEVKMVAQQLFPFKCLPPCIMIHQCIKEMGVYLRPALRW